MKKLDIAYTSPSTAENQNESLNVYAKAPTNPAPKTAYIFPFVNSPVFSASLRANAVIVQNKKRMVNALQRPDTALIIIPTLLVSPKANKLKKFPINRNKGAPGGWPTSNLYAQAMYSPQSQKDAVGSIVLK